MKNAFLAATAISTLATVASAEGLSYHGATFDGTVTSNYNGCCWSFNSAKRATSQYDFDGTPYFVQPEISLTSIGNLSSFGLSVGGHVGMQVNPDLAVGAFAIYNTWLPGFTGSDASLGAEVKGAFGDFGYEAFAAAFVDGGGIYGGTARIDVWRPISDRITLGAAAGVLATGGPTVFQASVKGSYAVSDQLDLNLGYTYTGGSGVSNHGIGVGLTYTLDKGTTFSARDFVSGMRLSF